MTDVKKSEIYPVFGCEICFVAIYAIFRISVLSRFTRFCVEKNWAENCMGGEKMTNMRYDPKLKVRMHVLKLDNHSRKKGWVELGATCPSTWSVALQLHHCLLEGRLALISRRTKNVKGIKRANKKNGKWYVAAPCLQGGEPHITWNENHKHWNRQNVLLPRSVIWPMCLSSSNVREQT